MSPLAAPVLPARYRVVERLEETHDTVTLWLRPVDQPIPGYRPGQFTMLYAPGIGEVPISVSGTGPDFGLVQTVRGGRVRALPARAPVAVPGRTGDQLRGGDAAAGDTGALMTATTRPRLAVWKFASCDGCQLTLLDCQDELLALAAQVEIAHFTEATKTDVAGPYDVSLVEGSVTTPEDAERIQRVRAQSRTLVTIGACATSGGVQALRNFADVAEFRAAVYARPEYVAALATSTPIAGHVEVDFELRGCPIDKRQLLELITALLAGRQPRIPGHSVCEECKRRGTACVMVAHGTPCLGPVTQAGCGAICPAYGRGCYGCFGPVAEPNTAALIPQLRRLGMDTAGVQRVFATFNVASPGFRKARDQAAASHPGDDAER